MMPHAQARVCILVSIQWPQWPVMVQTQCSGKNATHAQWAVECVVTWPEGCDTER